MPKRAVPKPDPLPPASQRAPRSEIPARQRLIDAATELFYQHGIECVGIDAIIEKAGVAKMSLYNHFDSKDELAAEVFRVRDQIWFEWFLREVNLRAESPRERLVAVFDVLRDCHAQADFAGCAFLNVAAEIRKPDHPARKIALDHHHRLRDYLTAQATLTGATDPTTLGGQLAILVCGCTLWATLERSPTCAERARSAAVQLIAGAISETSS